jgi:hypothetical protein
MPKKSSLAEKAARDERSVIAGLGDERRGEGRAIPILLENAQLLFLPTRPGIDEPAEAAAARAERMRAFAVRVLWVTYRKQLRRGEVDERVDRFFREQARSRIWDSDNPVAAMRDFLGRPKRGAPKQHAMRNFELAAEIEEQRESGKTLNEAITLVCERLQEAGEEPDEQYLKKIYTREVRHPVGKRAVQAWVKVRALRRGDRRP